MQVEIYGEIPIRNVHCRLLIEHLPLVQYQKNPLICRLTVFILSESTTLEDI